jgi:hypothetical protein
VTFLEIDERTAASRVACACTSHRRAVVPGPLSHVDEGFGFAVRSAHFKGSCSSCCQVLPLRVTQPLGSGATSARLSIKSGLSGGHVERRDVDWSGRIRLGSPHSKQHHSVARPAEGVHEGRRGSTLNGLILALCLRSASMRTHM